jgi:Flp pilus assembly protein CpaB
MTYYSPGTGPKTWHVVVFLGVVVLVVDIVSIQMLGTRTDQFQFVAVQPRPTADASRPAAVALPPGTDLIGTPFEVGTHVEPGDQVNVVASFRNGDEPKGFELLLNVPVIFVKRDVSLDKCGPFPNVDLVGLALTKKQMDAWELARARGYTLTLVVRSRDAKDDSGYNIDDVIRSLEEPKEPLREVAPAPRPVKSER